MKRIIAIVLVILMCLSLLPGKVAEANDDVKLRIHYHRFDDQYEGWNLWLWPDGKDGSAYEFDQVDDYGSYIQVTVPSTSDVNRIGLIVRLNEWEAKDVEKDRYIDISKVSDEGYVELFLLQADEKLYYSREDVDLSPKFISAKLIDEDRIELSVTVPFELMNAKKSFSIKNGESEEIKIRSLNVDTIADRISKATLTTEEPLKFSESYIIMKEGYGEMTVDMSKAFSMEEFEELYYYDGNDLGAIYQMSQTDFRLWAPTSSQAEVLLYEEGTNGEPYKIIEMMKDINGTYVASELGDLDGIYYTYRVAVSGGVHEAVDPYAKAVGVNGERGMIINLEATNPEEFKTHKKPVFDNFTDAIVYELHVRDLSIADNSGIDNKGKYLGLTELGTINDEGLKTGLDHLKELGITHLQLLPVFDYRTVDETRLDGAQFNWGYDPQNYNAPEGSYSTDPYNGAVRIKEFKEMVQALHENDIRVVMDVVYNHTGLSAGSHLNQLVPNYYYRSAGDKFSNGSGCGNEIASERAMVRKMIVDSVVYWASEYKIDGFRFDLMGLHDLQTMGEVRSALNEIDPSIIIYGEGWTGGASPLSESKRCIKANTYLLDDIGAFSDDLRDGIKGHVFESTAKGFVNGGEGFEESIKFGVIGGTDHQEVNYSKVNYSKAPWAKSPVQSVNYAEAHDNLTLWDKLLETNPDDSVEERKAMDKMSAAIFMTSQGVPFIHAGMEFLRTKEGDHNSYKSPDQVNQLDWSLKTKNQDVFNYYKGLIKIRKEHPAFRMATTEEIQKHLSFYGDNSDYKLPAENMVGYIINDYANGDEAGAVAVIFNANKEEQVVTLPQGEWTIIVNKDIANSNGIESFEGSSVVVKGLESVVLVNKESVSRLAEASDDIEKKEDTTIEEKANNRTSHSYVMPVLIGLVVMIPMLAFIGYKFFRNKKK